VTSTVVVRTPNWLGDTVMAMPALVALRAARADARIVVVGRWAEILRGQAVADVLVPYPRDGAQRKGIARALADDPAEVAVVLAGSFEAALAAWRWRARRRIGFDTDARAALLTDALALPAPRPHQVDEYRALVQALGARAEEDRPALVPVPDAPAETEVSTLLQAAGVPPDTRVVGLHIGASGGPAKLWPADRFALVADRLARSRLRVLVLGAPEDAPRAAAVLSAATSKPASLVGRDRPALLPHLVARLACLVSGDTGVAHLAAALGVPTVTLFGPTDPRLSAPRGWATARALTGPAPCAPCFRSECPIEHVCMRAIDTDAVAASVREIVRA
jgi:lipopolysaccharide heptosyltransferase II